MTAADLALAREMGVETLKPRDLERVEHMREAGRIVAQALATVRERVRPGVKTAELDAVVERAILDAGARPSFKGYRGFPAALCASVNEEIVHGIPGSRILMEGDIVSLDVGAYYRGYHGDSAVTVGVGKIGHRAEELMEVTRGSLYAGIAAARAGKHLGDISWAIQHHVESRGFAIIREYTGHGIGHKLHEEPTVLNFGRRGTGPVLRLGQTLALEPMVSSGDFRTKVLPDHWTVITKDRSLSAHFEHTILVLDGGAQILTEL